MIWSDDRPTADESSRSTAPTVTLNTPANASIISLPGQNATTTEPGLRCPVWQMMLNIDEWHVNHSSSVTRSILPDVTCQKAFLTLCGAGVGELILDKNHNEWVWIWQLRLGYCSFRYRRRVRSTALYQLQTQTALANPTPEQPFGLMIMMIMMMMTMTTAAATATSTTIPSTMFMVPSSQQSHCQSSLGSSDE